jgi:hypothetical protein
MCNHGVATLTKTVIRCLLIILCAACESGCRKTDQQRLADGITRAEKVVLYEGLPHQLFEKSLLDEELRTKKTIKVEGFPFYEEPLDLKEEHAKELTRLVSDAKSFQPHTEDKKCGGFHPDYLVEWRKGDEVYQCLTCFGCHEVKIAGPKVALHFDLVNEVQDRLTEVLKSYRKNRPAAKDE